LWRKKEKKKNQNQWKNSSMKQSQWNKKNRNTSFSALQPTCSSSPLYLRMFLQSWLYALK
jgi:hypothetical protein